MANLLFDALLGPHRDSSRVFLHLPDGDELCYRDFLDLASQFAYTLNNQGIKPGDRVVMQAHKSVEALALYVACVQTGAVFLPLNTAYKSVEVEYFVADAQAKLIICNASNSDSLQVIADKYKAKKLTLNADKSGSLLSQSEGNPTDFQVVDRSANDLAALLYTSGTTGRSKGAMLSHNNLLSNARTLLDSWCFKQEDVLLHALPIFHTHGLFVATNTLLLAGGSMLFLPKFDVDQVIEALPKATSMMGVPTFYTRLLDEERLNHQLVENMRLFISGSAPLLAETHWAFEKRTGHKILERYGMTETNMNTSNPYEGLRKAGTVGPALPQVEVKVCDVKTGEELTQGEIGILQVRGPNVFLGYWRLPEKTAEELLDDGFFITGDLACIDEDGYVQIVGRGKDLIITGGYNVYPKEVELLLDEQEGVLESAVIGVPHHDFGEAVVAVLVAKKGVLLDETIIMQNIQENMASFKQPKRLIIVDDLPRNTMGKVQKNLLREQYKKLFLNT